MAEHRWLVLASVLWLKFIKSRVSLSLISKLTDYRLCLFIWSWLKILYCCVYRGCQTKLQQHQKNVIFNCCWGLACLHEGPVNWDSAFLIIVLLLVKPGNSPAPVYTLIHFLFICSSELHCHSWMQWYWHHHRSHPQWHQPPWKEEDGSGAGTQSEWLLVSSVVLKR